MALLLILTLLGLLWIASLFKIIFGPMMLSRVTFLADDEGRTRRNVLLVVAHPDDESMFFVPTVLHLTSTSQHNVRVLCISTGNVEGKGYIRKDEMLHACSVLKVPISNVNILDHPELQDGFDKPWSHQLLAEIVGQKITAHGVDTIITFDNYGVSGHPQHRALHYGVRMFLMENAKQTTQLHNKSVDVWELVSVNIIRKYFGPLDVWCSILCSLWLTKGEPCCMFNKHPQICFLAMGQHNSQWLWYRKLFVIFSSYTYMNTLTKVKLQ